MIYRLGQSAVAIMVIAAILAGMYLIAVYSSIPFIDKWRTIYIETAMSTMTHQWLATAFIPKRVVDKVMNDKVEYDTHLDELVSQWKNVRVFEEKSDTTNIERQGAIKIISSEDRFYDKFWEIDRDSLESYLLNNPEKLETGYGDLYINMGENNDSGNNIKTIFDESVYVVDTKNNILIVEVTGEGYKGKLAIIKDPAQVKIGLSSKLGEVGERLNDIIQKNDAILGINASGFVDTEWKGNGGEVVGLLVKDGKQYNKSAGGTQVAIGFDSNNNMVMGKYNKEIELRDAVESKPALVINGEKIIEGSAGWGIQPRTAIGQSKTGEVLLLVIDGRQVGHSIGATMGQCADIMVTHDALQAAALDGGSSALMVYRGEEITNSCVGSNGTGRKIPNAFIVTQAEK